jgi:hypothetical protein
VAESLEAALREIQRQIAEKTRERDALNDKLLALESTEIALKNAIRIEKESKHG